LHVAFPLSDALFDRALDWIDRHLGEFDPMWKPDAFDFERGQRMGELAILARAAAPMAGADPRIARIVALLARAQSSPVYADRVLRAPIEFMLFLENYASLCAFGHDDPLLRGRLQKAVRAGWLHQTERFPHRAMDIRSCLDACGIACDLPPLDELYRRSILGMAPNPILLGEHDLYALTHVIMFLCDFGRRAPDALSREDRDAVAALITAQLVVAARDRHWDLLAEFLLCWSCLGLPETGLIEKAWDALAAAQMEDGAVPGPEVKTGAVRFEHLYHTTLVCALAASVRHGKSAGSGGKPDTRRVAAAEHGHDEAQLADVARRAHGWLARCAAAELAGAEQSPLRLSQIVAGLSCCVALAGETPSADLIRRIVRALADKPASGAWDTVPPLLKCVVAAAASRHGVSIAPLHAADGFLRRAQAFFQGATGAIDTIEMTEIRETLHQLGLVARPPPVSAADVLAHASAMTLDGDPAHVERLLLLLDGANACGLRRSQLPEQGNWLADFVAGLAVDALRRYDLMRGARFLRAGASIGAGQLQRQCAHYLIFNQREDGAFGLFGPELAQRRQQLGTAADDHLPVTVDCLLALAEYFRDWRLLDEFKADAPAVQGMLRD